MRMRDIGLSFLHRIYKSDQSVLFAAHCSILALARVAGKAKTSPPQYGSATSSFTGPMTTLVSMPKTPGSSDSVERRKLL